MAPRSRRAPGQHQLHLGPFSRRRPHLAVPPSRVSRPLTESRSPRRSSGTVSGSNPLPRSRTNTDTRSGSTSMYRRAAAGRRVLRRVDQRLAGRGTSAARPRRSGRRRRRRLDQRPRGRSSISATSRDHPGPGAAGGRRRVVQPGAQLALLAAGQPADGRGSSACRWIRARVCSTESCRCAATVARSSERMRAARSASRESSSRRHSGAVTRTIPARITSVAAKPSRALAQLPRGRQQQDDTRPAPGPCPAGERPPRWAVRSRGRRPTAAR